MPGHRDALAGPARAAGEVPGRVGGAAGAAAGAARGRAARARARHRGARARRAPPACAPAGGHAATVRRHHF